MIKRILTIFILTIVPNISFGMQVKDIAAKDYVTDYTNTLTSDQILEVSKVLGEIEKNKGYQLGVIIIPKMTDEFGREDYIEHFSVKLYEKLGLGTKEKDEGLLWIIVKDSRKSRIEVGYGLESLFTDGVTKEIQEKAKIFFKQENYFSGVMSGVKDMKSISEQGLSQTKKTSILNFFKKIPFEFYIFLFFTIFNIIGWIISILARTKEWWLGGVITAFFGLPIFYIFGLLIFPVLFYIGFIFIGFLVDFFVSKNYKYWQKKLVEQGDKHGPDWWAGGTWGPGSSSWKNDSGFGGFGGGGMSGGGGSSVDW